MNWRTFSGYGLLVLGIAGCLLPIVPGIPFLIGAAAVLGWDHPLIRPWAKYIRRHSKDTQERSPKDSASNSVN